MAEGFAFDKQSTERISDATVYTEGLRQSHEQRPRKSRSVVIPIDGLRRVIVREIPNPAGATLHVEAAVKHPDYAGDEDESNTGRWIAASELNGSEPALEMMMVKGHRFAGDYENYRWVGPTSRSTDILDAYRVAGAWEVWPDPRLYEVKLSQSAPVGSCNRWQDLQGL